MDQQRAEYKRTWEAEQRRLHPEKLALRNRNGRLRWLYKIDVVELERRIEAQGGVCGNPECDRPATDVDHNHRCPGNVTCGECLRSILCRQCNQAAGLLLDDARVIRGLQEYIESWT